MNDYGIRACCFDLGNTLSDDTRLTERSVERMGLRLEEEGHVDDAGRFTELYHEINASYEVPFVSHTYGELGVFETVFRRLGVTGIDAGRALAIYRSIVREETAPADELREALEHLSSLGIRRAILSNERSERVEAYLETTGLGPLFDTVVVSERVGIEKPDPRIFREILRRLDIPPEEARSAALFGDNSIADGACRVEGMRFVLVTGYLNRKWYYEKGEEHPADFEIEKVTKESVQRVIDAFSRG